MFTRGKVVSFAQMWGINLIQSSLYCAQANGQVEGSNRIIIEFIKKNVKEKPRKWYEKCNKYYGLFGTLKLMQHVLHLIG